MKHTLYSTVRILQKGLSIPNNPPCEIHHMHNLSGRVRTEVEREHVAVVQNVQAQLYHPHAPL